MKFDGTKLPNASRFAAGLNGIFGIIMMAFTFYNKIDHWMELIGEFGLFIIGAVFVYYYSIPEFRQAALEDRTLKAMINEKEWNKEK